MVQLPAAQQATSIVVLVNDTQWLVKMFRCNNSVEEAPTKRRVRLLPILALCAVLVGVVAIAAILWQHHSISRERQAVAEQFQIFSVALSGCDSAMDRLPVPIVHYSTVTFPPPLDCNGNGPPLYSWRFGIWHFYTNWLCGDYDMEVSWDSPVNRDLLAYLDYFLWGSGNQTVIDANRPLGNATIFAITGPDTAFGDGGDELPKALRDVPNDTILVAEVRNSGVPWPAPGDFDIRTMPHTINAPDGKGISSRLPDGFHVLFADGQIWFISNKVPFDTLAKFFTISGAKEHDREKLLGPYALERKPGWS